MGILTVEATGDSEIPWGELWYGSKEGSKESSNEHKNLMAEDKAMQKQKEQSTENQKSQFPECLDRDFKKQVINSTDGFSSSDSEVWFWSPVLTYTHFRQILLSIWSFLFLSS